MPRGECKKFSAQRCLLLTERGGGRVIFVNFNRLWACPNVFVECGVNLLNQKLKNIAIVLSLVLTPSFVDSQWLWVSLIFSFHTILQIRLPSRFRNASITELAISGRKKKRELKCFAFPLNGCREWI